MATLPTACGAPAVTRTHVSTLFFVGDRVYKLKRPVALGFLDFSSRAERERACHREVELNRRLAPDVYLGVLDVTEAGGGEPVDHLVAMRRMPADRCLETLVRGGAEVEAELRSVARTVAAFHARCPTSEEIAGAGTVEAVRRLWAENGDGLRRFVGTVLDPDMAARVAERAGRYLDGRAPLFARRIADGRIRDGHGDLLAADVYCLPDGPRILDCIEFDDRLRHGDVVADIAFLAMDLERLGRPDLGRRFLEEYREFSGDTWPESLAHHHIAYRAAVRAKVACLRHEQGETDAAGEARHLLRLAFTHAERARVTLTLVGGLPGTGKSTLAADITGALGSSLLRSDEVRRDLVGRPDPLPSAAGFGEGTHAPVVTERTYTVLLDRARQLLEHGESVVLDATWLDRRWRRRAAEVATATSSDLVELECRAPRELAERRIEARRLEGRDLSDATVEVARRMELAATPWTTAVPVDTTGGRPAELATALRAIGESARRAAPPDAIIGERE